MLDRTINGQIRFLAREATSRSVKDSRKVRALQSVILLSYVPVEQWAQRHRMRATSLSRRQREPGRVGLRVPPPMLEVQVGRIEVDVPEWEDYFGGFAAAVDLG